MRLPAASQPAEEHVDQGQNDGADESRAECVHVEARNDGGSQFDHGGINDQPEQPERKQNQGESDDLEKDSQRGIDEANDQRGNQRGKRPMT